MDQSNSVTVNNIFAGAFARGNDRFRGPDHPSAGIPAGKDSAGRILDGRGKLVFATARVVKREKE